MSTPVAVVLPSSVVIGFASGLRSSTGVAAFAHTRYRGTRHARFADRLGAVALFGEAVADKLPMTPSRLQMPGLLARVAAGALGAWALATRDDEPTPAIAAALGAVSALAGSYAGAAYRAAVVQKVPDVVGAVAEDAAALGLAWSALGAARR